MGFFYAVNSSPQYSNFVPHIQPLGIITLLSDMGTRDAGATVAKAVFMRHAPGVHIVDISHQVAEYDLQEAAYMLLAAYHHFPKGTVHVLMADVYRDGNARMLLAMFDGYYFIAPDNGLLALAFGTALTDVRLCATFAPPFVFSDWTESAGLAVAAVLGNNISYPATTMHEVPLLSQPKITPDGVECRIRYIDRYGNVVLDITRKQFDRIVKGRDFSIEIMKTQNVTTISSNYNDVAADQALCRFNDAGFLLIALNHGCVAKLLGLDTEHISNIRYKTIKIFF